MIWDKHASAVGTLLLVLCLAGGAAYQQAPMRTPASGAVTPATVSGEGKRTDSEPAARAAGEAELAPLASERVKVDVDSAEPVAEVPSDLAEPTPPRSRAVAAGLA
jgi:hypothetical protein